MRALLTIVFQKALYDVFPLLKGGMHTIKYNTCCIMKKNKSPNCQNNFKIQSKSRRKNNTRLPDETQIRCLISNIKYSSIGNNFLRLLL